MTASNPLGSTQWTSAELRLALLEGLTFAAVVDAGTLTPELIDEAAMDVALSAFYATSSSGFLGGNIEEKFRAALQAYLARVKTPNPEPRPEHRALVAAFESAVQQESMVGWIVDAADRKRLDFLTRKTCPDLAGWVCRKSVTNRGWRLHEVSSLDQSLYDECYPDPRSAIDAAMAEDPKSCEEDVF